MDKQEEGGASTRLLEEVSGLLRWARASAKGGIYKYLLTAAGRTCVSSSAIKKHRGVSARAV